MGQQGDEKKAKKSVKDFSETFGSRKTQEFNLSPEILISVFHKLKGGQRIPHDLAFKKRWGFYS